MKATMKSQGPLCKCGEVDLIHKDRDLAMPQVRTYDVSCGAPARAEYA